jgi:small subunit ribosomal protein S20
MEVNLMPIIKSAIERVKTNNKANARNTAQMSAMRTAVKKFEAAKTAGADNVDELYVAAASAVDKAASKGLIKRNKAARDKSRMAARYAK